MRHCELTIGARLDCTDPAERPAGEAKALQKLAQRIRSFPEGKFTPSPPPRLLHELTDEILVVASSAVAGVGREEPALSTNAALRLLAWTVADALGASVVLDKPLALMVGKRLDRQAQSVRANFRAITARAAEARTSARDAAAGDPALTARLPRVLSAIDSEERTAMALACTEVYVGFNELESLLPENEVDEPVLPELSAAPAAPAAPAVPTSTRDPDPRGPLIHFPLCCDHPLPVGGGWAGLTCLAWRVHAYVHAFRLLPRTDRIEMVARFCEVRGCSGLLLCVVMCS